MHYNSVVACLTQHVHNTRPQAAGQQSQDCHELLRLLLEGLQTEERRLRQLEQRHAGRGGGSTSPGGSPAATAAGSSVATAPEAAAAGAAPLPATADELPTFVDQIFGGVLTSTTTCAACAHCTSSCQPFLTLSLPVPSSSGRGASSDDDSRPSTSCCGTAGSISISVPRKLSSPKVRALTEEHVKCHLMFLHRPPPWLLHSAVSKFDRVARRRSRSIPHSRTAATLLTFGCAFLALVARLPW